MAVVKRAIWRGTYSSTMVAALIARGGSKPPVAHPEPDSRTSRVFLCPFFSPSRSPVMNATLTAPPRPFALLPKSNCPRSRSSAAHWPSTRNCVSRSISPRSAAGPCWTSAAGHVVIHGRGPVVAMASMRSRWIRATWRRRGRPSGAGGARITITCLRRCARSRGCCGFRSFASIDEAEADRRLATRSAFRRLHCAFTARPVLRRRAAAAAVLQGGTFDLVLCAHLLFTYARRFDFARDLAAGRELARVSVGDVRLHPGCRPRSPALSRAGPGCGGSQRQRHRERSGEGGLRVFRRHQLDAGAERGQVMSTPARTPAPPYYAVIFTFAAHGGRSRL